MSGLPWDARIARWMIQPLIGTPVTPNHLTTARLLVGLACLPGLASGDYFWSNVGAWLFALSSVLDHTDGELARATGRFSRFGHFYDLACDALIHVLLFVAIGWGLRTGPLGDWALGLGAVAGVAVSAMFYMRMEIEERRGKAATRLPSYAGFEIEDVLYVLPLVTLIDGLQPFLLAAAVGAPLFMVWIVRDYLRP